MLAKHGVANSKRRVRDLLTPAAEVSLTGASRTLGWLILCSSSLEHGQVDT
jgi:hypothetical protein